MKIISRKNLTVLAAGCGFTGDAFLHHIFDIFQDISTENSREFKMDSDAMANESNAYWIVQKNRVRIHKMPHIYDDITVETWPNAPGNVRCDRNCRIKDRSGAVMVEGRSQWVILDRDTHMIRKISSTVYPINGEHIEDKLLTEPFLRLNEQFGDEDFVYSHRVKMSDMDISNHTNNVAYIRIMTDALEPSFFSENEIYEFEIEYKKESHYGDELKIYKKERDGKIYLAAIGNEGINAVCVMTLK